VTTVKNPIQPPPDRVQYTIKNDGNYFTAGVDGQGRQVLMGILFGATSPEVVAVFFDRLGDYLGSLAEPVVPRPSENDEVAAGRALAGVQSAIGLTPASITVKRFWLDDRHVGISDLPEHYQDFLNNPEKFDEQRRAELSGDVQRWFSEGDFVLWWGEDYYLDKEGDVSSS
jgi:hypothetical protein